jgi:hypothetical protein
MTQPITGADKPRTSSPVKMIAKWVGGILTAVLIAVIPSFVKSSHGAAKPHETSPITFSGRVTDNGAKAIQGATVIATIDQSVGEPIRADSNGQFQVQLPADTQSLRLTVNADGYGPETIQANIHRTGPEEIYMHRLPAPDKPVTIQPRKLANPPPVAKVEVPPPQIASPAPPPPLTCYGSNCAGVNNGTQIINGPVDRHLSPAQTDAISEAIDALPPGMKVQVYTVADSEASTFAGEINSIILSKKKADDLIEDLEPAPKGVYLMIHSKDDSAFTYAQKLGNALQHNGIPVTSFEPHDYIRPGSIRLFISQH